MTRITSVVLSSPAPEGPGATSAECMVAPELRGIIIDQLRMGHIPYGLDTDRVVGVGCICHEKRGRHSQEKDSFVCRLHHCNKRGQCMFCCILLSVLLFCPCEA